MRKEQATDDPTMLGHCDYCDGTYVLGSDDHNGETGNHYECEEVEK